MTFGNNMYSIISKRWNGGLNLKKNNLNKLLIIKRDPNVEIEYNILNGRLKKIVNEINTCESRGCWYEYCYRN